MATARQEMLLLYLRTFLDAEGRPPSLREIGNDMSMSHSGASNYLKALRRLGWVAVTPKVSRGIRITAAGERAADEIIGREKHGDGEKAQG